MDVSRKETTKRGDEEDERMHFPSSLSFYYFMTLLPRSFAAQFIRLQVITASFDPSLPLMSSCVADTSASVADHLEEILDKRCPGQDN